MKTFSEYLIRHGEVFSETASGFELESTVEMYKRLGGNGKTSIPYPNMPGMWLHPNGIVSPDLPEGSEYIPFFDPYDPKYKNGYFFGDVHPVVQRLRQP